MKAIQFGTIGACVEDFTKESLHAFLKSHYLDELLNNQYFKNSEKFTSNMYLQSGSYGPHTGGIALNVHGGFVRYVTDMDTFLLILRTGILSPDAANGLVDELYSQGLIKPKNNHE